MYYKLEGNALDAYNKKVDEAKRKLMMQEGLTEDQIIVRILRAEDIGFADSQFKKAIAKANTNAWNNIVNTITIADARFVVINGVNRGFGQGTTNVFSQLRITNAGKTARIWNIQGVEDLITNTKYFTDPILIAQNNQLTIEGYAVNSTTDKMVMLGAAIEKKGLIVNP